jgi:ACS family glucarate transporter-like MFS transporter
MPVGEIEVIPRPSRIRYIVLGLTVLMAVLLYLDRVCMSVAALPISEQLELDEKDMGWVLSAFFWAYALAQVPAGWLGERLGPRVALSLYVLAWSLFTALTGLVNGFIALIAARFLFGLAQAGAYPIAARIISVWVPFRNRAMANGLVTMGGRLGGAVAPALTGTLIFWTEYLTDIDKWRPIFWLYSLLGVAWSLAFYQWYRTTPAEHPHCNTAEVTLVELGRPVGATDPRGSARGVPWHAIFVSLGLWMQCALQFISNIAWILLITWAPKYFKDVHHLTITESGFLASLPLVGGLTGCLLGGWITDRLTGRFGLRIGRCVPGMGSKFLAGLGMIGAVMAPGPYSAAAALTFAAFVNDLGLSAIWAYFQDAGGSYVASLVGWTNMWGNFGAAVGTVLVGYLVKDFGWSVTLSVSATCYVIGGLCWFGIDPRKAIVTD